MILIVVIPLLKIFFILLIDMQINKIISIHILIYK